MSKYGYERLNSGPAICFLCDCCNSRIYDTAAGWHVPNPLDRYTSKSLLCDSCMENEPWFYYDTNRQAYTPKDYSCRLCVRTYQQWQKRSRIGVRVAVLALWNPKHLGYAKELYVLVRDYLLEKEFTQRISMRPETIQRQTLPRTLIPKNKR